MIRFAVRTRGTERYFSKYYYSYRYTQDQTVNNIYHAFLYKSSTEAFKRAAQMKEGEVVLVRFGELIPL